MFLPFSVILFLVLQCVSLWQEKRNGTLNLANWKFICWQLWSLLNSSHTFQQTDSSIPNVCTISIQFLTIWLMCLKSRRAERMSAFPHRRTHPQTSDQPHNTWRICPWENVWPGEATLRRKWRDFRHKLCQWEPILPLWMEYAGPCSKGGPATVTFSFASLWLCWRVSREGLTLSPHFPLLSFSPLILSFHVALQIELQTFVELWICLKAWLFPLTQWRKGI